MEDVVVDLTRGNPGSVKTVLASVILALAVYQLLLAAIGYRKLPVGRPGPAFFTHRASGDTLAVLIVVVALMCLTVFGFEGDYLLHTIAAIGALVVLAIKITVVRSGRGGQLPADEDVAFLDGQERFDAAFRQLQVDGVAQELLQRPPFRLHPPAHGDVQVAVEIDGDLALAGPDGRAGGWKPHLVSGCASAPGLRLGRGLRLAGSNSLAASRRPSATARTRSIASS